MRGYRGPARLERALIEVHRRTNGLIQSVLFAAIGALAVGPALIAVGAAPSWGYQFLPEAGRIRTAYLLGMGIVILQVYRYGPRFPRSVNSSSGSRARFIPAADDGVEGVKPASPEG